MPMFVHVGCRDCYRVLTDLSPWIYSYDELVKDYEVTYVAGGAAQNAARAAAVSGL